MDTESFYLFLSANDFSFFILHGASIALLLLLVLVSFWASGSEVALFSLSKANRQLLHTKHPAHARRIEYLYAHPKEALVALVLINTFANIGVILVMNVLLHTLFSSLPPTVSWIITLVIEVFLLIIFAEITPKILASKNNIRYALSALPALYYVFKILLPLSRIVTRITRSSEHILNSVTPPKPTQSTEELDQAIALTSDKEHRQEEIKLLQSVVHFKHIKVKQVMNSRLDICAIDDSEDFDSLKKIIRSLNYSRLPVYKGDLDHVVGMLYVKDLLPVLNQKKDFKWQKCMRSVHFVYEFNSIETLLVEFKKKSVHIAVVVDEFGTTQGIITMEDILEEIVGDIRDEFDEEGVAIKETAPNTYLAEGKISLNDFARFFNLSTHSFDDIRQDSDTLAGLILEITKKIPAKKEVIKWGDFTFTVEEIRKNRLTKIRVERLNNESEKEEKNAEKDVT